MPEKIGVATDSCRTVPIEKMGIPGPLGTKYPGPAVIFGDPVTVPAFQLRFVDEKSAQSVAPSKIAINYSWRWLEYPYPEHSWGAWSDVSDLIECPEPGAETLVAEYEVRPRGWYNGKYAKFPFVGKRPYFTRVSISLAVNGCTEQTGASISAKEARKLKDKSVVFKVNCNGKSTIVIE